MREYFNKYFSHCSVCKLRSVGYKPLPEIFVNLPKKHGFRHIPETLSVNRYECANCGASDRERLIAFWLKEISIDQISKSNILHFSPELALGRLLRSLNSSFYFTLDLLNTNVDLSCNIENLALKDNSIDLFICSHVLEHVQDDKKALSELFRIMKQEGKGVIIVPIALDIMETDEDIGNISIDERWRRFGQDDHMRLYSKQSFLCMLRQAGFSVAEYGAKNIGWLKRVLLGITITSTIYIVSK